MRSLKQQRRMDAKARRRRYIELRDKLRTAPSLNTFSAYAYRSVTREMLVRDRPLLGCESC